MTGRAGKLLPWISTAVAIVVVIAIWKLVIAVFNVSPFVLPQPEDVLSGVRDLVQSKNLWSDARVTLEETLVGFAIALVLGLALGIVLGRVTWLEQAMLKTGGDTMVMETEEIGGGRSTRRAFMSRSAGALAAVGGAGGLLAAGAPPSRRARPTKAASSGTVQVVNILPPQLGYAAEYIADMDGFFKKEGLTVKANTARGSAPAIQAILSRTALLSWVG